MSVKSKILKILTEAEGDFVSGQSLGKQLFCSRNAVWKAIEALRQEGYRIEAVTNKGYALVGGDVFSVEGISRYLTAPFTVDVRESVTSTNDVLKAAAERGANEGYVIAAVEQTGGKGRMGRSFFSPESGLYFSILLRPKISAQDSLMITTAAAVSVVSAIGNVCGKSCGIKWVNDVFLNGLKICGILTEASVDFETGGLQYAVLGIGINVANPAENFPSELQGIAGAIYDRIPQDEDIKNRLCAEVLNCFYEYYQDLPARTFMEEYKAHSILVGRKINVIRGERTVGAVAMGIDDYARLLVRYEDGTEEAISAGEVSIRF